MPHLLASPSPKLLNSPSPHLPIPGDRLASAELSLFYPRVEYTNAPAFATISGMMPRKVLFYGSSLLLALVAESLEQSPGLHVARAATWAEASRTLAEYTPDTLIFDLSQDHESHILPLLLKNPKLLLIGLDPECNQAILLSGQKAHSLTLNQLSQIVQEEDPAIPGGVP